MLNISFAALTTTHCFLPRAVCLGAPTCRSVPPYAYNDSRGIISKNKTNHVHSTVRRGDTHGLPLSNLKAGLTARAQWGDSRVQVPSKVQDHVGRLTPHNHT